MQQLLQILSHVLTIIVLGIALGRNCDRQNSASGDELFEEFVLFETFSFTTKLKHLKIVLCFETLKNCIMAC